MTWHYNNSNTQWFDVDGNSHWYEGEILPCPYCGSENNEYLGELYDDTVYEGSDYRCLECGHNWVDGRMSGVLGALGPDDSGITGE